MYDACHNSFTVRNKHASSDSDRSIQLLNPGQLDTGQLDTGHLDTGHLDTGQLDTHENGKVGQLDTSI